MADDYEIDSFDPEKMMKGIEVVEEPVNGSKEIELNENEENDNQSNHDENEKSIEIDNQIQKKEKSKNIEKKSNLIDEKPSISNEQFTLQQKISSNNPPSLYMSQSTVMKEYTEKERSLVMNAELGKPKPTTIDFDEKSKTFDSTNLKDNPYTNQTNQSINKIEEPKEMLNKSEELIKVLNEDMLKEIKIIPHLKFVIASKDTFESFRDFFLDSQNFNHATSIEIIYLCSSNFEYSDNHHKDLVKNFFKLENINTLVSLKVKIMRSKINEISLQFIGKLPKSLKYFKLIIESENSIKIPDISIFSSYFMKNLEIFKFWLFCPGLENYQCFLLKRPQIKTLHLGIPLLIKNSQEIPFECINLQNFSTNVNENEQSLKNFFRKHQNLRVVSLFFKIKEIKTFEIIQEVIKLSFLTKISINFDEDASFSDKLLSDLLKVFFNENDQLINLITLEIQIKNYYPNYKSIQSELIPMNVSQKFPKLANFKINSVEIQTLLKINQPLDIELKNSLRVLLLSKTFIDLIEDPDFELSFFSTQYQFTEDEIVNNFIEFDKIYSSQENFYFQKGNSSYFSFSFEDPKKLIFFLKTMKYFLKISEKITEIFFYFSKIGIAEDNEIRELFKEYSTPKNFNIHIKISDKLFEDWQFPIIEKITKLKLIFKDSLPVGKTFLENLNKNNRCFPNISGFYLNIENSVSMKNNDNDINFPSKLFSQKIEHIWISLTNFDLSDRDFSIFNNFNIFLKTFEYRSSIKHLEIAFKNMNLFRPSKYLQSLNESLNSLSQNLETLNLHIPGLKFHDIKDDVFADEVLYKRLENLNLKSIKILDLNFDSTGAGHKTLCMIEDFLKEKSDLKKFSLSLENNELTDNSIISFWSSINNKNVPNLKELRLYLNKNNFSCELIPQIADALRSFPEELTYLKIDLADNNLKTKKPDVLLSFSNLVEILINRLKNLDHLQFHMRKCKLGIKEILNFLTNLSKIKANIVDCRLGFNKNFWEEKWKNNELEELKQNLTRDFIAKKTIIDFKPGKSFKKNENLKDKLNEIIKILNQSKSSLTLTI